MIISHQHKFIFVKTEKTAGTSLEIALSKYCGPDDVLSSLTPKDESIRRALGYPGAQNYRLPFSQYSVPDALRCLRLGKPLHFFNHARALFIRNHIDPEAWHSYYKFCFERNPWDKFVSWYYWTYKGEPRPPIAEAVQSREFKAFRARGWNVYTEKSKVIVDRVFRYDQLPQALSEIQEKIGLEELPIMPQTKNSHRKDKRAYQEILSRESREIIGESYREEIDLFDFEW